MSISLKHVANQYEAAHFGGGRALKTTSLMSLLSGLTKEADVRAVLQLVMGTPLYACKMNSIVPQLVALRRKHNRNEAATPNTVSDPTLGLEEYIKILGAGHVNVIFRDDMPFAMALEALMEGRRSTDHLKQVMREIARSTPPVARLLKDFYTVAWKIPGIGQGTMLKVVKQSCAHKDVDFDKAAAMTKSMETLAECWLSGKPPRLTGKMAVTPVLLNKQIFNSAQSALDALGGKRGRDGTSLNAIATLKIDGFSVNLSFYRDDDGVVHHQIAFRTRGSTWTIGAGMASIAMAIATELSKDPSFKEMIVGGEAVVLDSDGVMMPSLMMHDWNKPGNRLGLIVYHMILLNGEPSGSISKDLDAIDSVFSPRFVENVKQSAIFGSAFLASITGDILYRLPDGSGFGTLPMRKHVPDVSTLDRYFQQVKDAGLEGIVLTNRQTGIQIGATTRNQNILKMKPERAVLDARIIGFNKRLDGTVKELAVAVASPDTTVMFSYATVGNLTNFARKALAHMLSKRVFGALQGNTNVPLPPWLRAAAPAAGTFYLHMKNPKDLPLVKIQGYPSALVCRRYGRDMPSDVPPSLTFAKLVPDSVKELLGSDDTLVNWQTNPFEMNVSLIIQTKEPDTKLFLGKVIHLIKPKMELEKEDAQNLIEELVRHSATVVLTVDSEVPDYVVDPQNQTHWDWVFQSAVADRVLPFPTEDADDDVQIVRQCVCPSCGHEF